MAENAAKEFFSKMDTYILAYKNSSSIFFLVHFVIFKLNKVNNGPIGENSGDLVNLLKILTFPPMTLTKRFLRNEGFELKDSDWKNRTKWMIRTK
jgi:hypothetical protein